MGSCTPLNGYPPLVITCLPIVFVVFTWSPLNISSFRVLSSRVALTVQSMLFRASPLAPSITVRHMLFGFSSDKLLCVPRVFPYLPNLCKFLVWCQRHDHRFRSVPPGALRLLACLKSRANFYLPLFFKRFLFQRRRRYFHRRWGANGVVGRVSGGSFKLSF